MLYLISDIHGNLLEFKQILKKIEFDGEKDNLIINIKKQTNVDIDINSIMINGICEKCKSKIK